MICDHCQREVKTKPDKRGADRVPNGWKRFHDSLWCSKCWQDKYVLRAIAFPVASPLGIEWPEFRKRLTTAWANTTGLANWTVTAMAKAEHVRMPGDPKLGPAVKQYLYPQARACFPDLEPQSLVAVQHAVANRYNKARFKTVWTCEASLQRFRYPQAFPVPAQSWGARWLTETEHVPIVRVRLGNEQLELRLAGGNGFRRQLADFARLIAGDCLPGTLEIYSQRASKSDNRPTVETGKPGGGQTVYNRVMVKLALWLPRTQKPGGVTVKVSTAKDAFLRVDAPGWDFHPYHMEHVVRRIEEHRQYLDAMSDDTKFEKRWPKRKRAQMNDAREATVAKHLRFIATFCHELSASVVKFAIRQRAGKLEYDDTERGYLASFPWHQLKQLLSDKCQRANIEFASGEVAQDPAPDASADGVV